VPGAQGGYDVAMYFDVKPCRECGAEVEIRPHERLEVNEADSSIDERVCTNPDCPTRSSGADGPRA
jgi:hypothetical protein